MILTYGIIFGLLCIALFVILLKTFKNVLKAAFGVLMILVISTVLITTYTFYDLNQLGNALEESPAFIVRVDDSIVTTAILPNNESEAIETLNVDEIDFESTEQERLIFAFDIEYFNESHSIPIPNTDEATTNFEEIFTATSIEELSAAMTEDNDFNQIEVLENTLENTNSSIETIKGNLLLSAITTNAPESGVMLEIVQGIKEETVEVNKNYFTFNLLTSVPQTFMNALLDEIATDDE